MSLAQSLVGQRRDSWAWTRTNEAADVILSGETPSHRG